MGSLNVAVVNSPATAVLQKNHGLVAISNIGDVTVYLDDTPGLSPDNNDYILTPGDKITWQAGVECWAITDPTTTGLLSVSQNILQFSAPAIIAPPTNAVITSVTGVIATGSYVSGTVTITWYELATGATFNSSAGLVWVLAIGGGGGGNQGGGGAGGVYENPTYYLNAGTHVVTNVGLGGPGTGFANIVAAPGTPTVLDGIALAAGGGGGMFSDIGARGGDGANGGGSGGNATGPGDPGGIGVAGNNGGSGGGAGNASAGGGGGAGGPGGAGISGVGGNGGPGHSSTITGTLTGYAGGGAGAGSPSGSATDGGGGPNLPGAPRTGGGGGCNAGIGPGTGGSGTLIVATYTNN